MLNCHISSSSSKQIKKFPARIQSRAEAKAELTSEVVPQTTSSGFRSSNLSLLQSFWPGKDRVTHKMAKNIKK